MTQAALSARQRIGFVYTVEHLRAGRVIEREVVCNLVPLLGLNAVLNYLFKGASVPATWYIGLYEGNYTPTDDDAAATFPTVATETTAYDEATRVAFVPGTVAGGTVDNGDSRAEFTFNATKTIYGGFLTSASAKNATSGVIVSAVKFASPKNMTAGDVLRVTAGITLTSDD